MDELKKCIEGKLISIEFESMDILSINPEHISIQAYIMVLNKNTKTLCDICLLMFNLYKALNLKYQTFCYALQNTITSFKTTIVNSKEIILSEESDDIVRPRTPTFNKAKFSTTMSISNTSSSPPAIVYNKPTNMISRDSLLLEDFNHLMNKVKNSQNNMHEHVGNLLVGANKTLKHINDSSELRNENMREAEITIDEYRISSNKNNSPKQVDPNKNIINSLKEKLAKRKEDLKISRKKIIFLKLSYLNILLELEEEERFRLLYAQKYKKKFNTTNNFDMLKTYDMKSSLPEPYDDIFNQDWLERLKISQKNPIALDPALIATHFKQEIEKLTQFLKGLVTKKECINLKDEDFPLKSICQVIADRRRKKFEMFEFILKNDTSSSSSYN
ncbi:unnamed protein product [Gordionus sp. m RMFG-2023]